MAHGIAPGPVCAAAPLPPDVDDQTMCLAPSPAPGPAAACGQGMVQVAVTPPVKTAVEIAFDVSAPMTWDSFQRLAYDKLADAIGRQARQLVERGYFTHEEVGALVESRNRRLLEIRGRLSPFGRLYSEILKPAAGLKDLDRFLQDKGTLRAVLESVGKTRASVDRIAVVSRVAGPALIVLDVTLTGVAIAQAPGDRRGRVAAREATGMAAGIAGGLAGAWAGCATFSAFASPSLVLPVVGEVATGTACLVGGALGGMGAGYFGREAGKLAGQAAHDWSTSLTWE